MQTCGTHSHGPVIPNVGDLVRRNHAHGNYGETMRMVAAILNSEVNRILACIYLHTRTQDSIPIPAQGVEGIFRRIGLEDTSTLAYIG